MYIFNMILMDGKSTKLQRTFFDVSLKDKKSLWFQRPLLISFQYFENASRLAVSFRCNLILMYFFKVISSHLEISYVIIQCLRIVTLIYICSDLICLQSQWFSAHILSKFPGNGQRRRPFLVSCRFMKTSMKTFSFQ